MNKTIITICIALLMLGIPASAKVSPAEDMKAEVGEEIGIQNASCGLGDGVHSLAEGAAISSSLPAVVGASCEFSFTPAAGADVARVVLNGLQSDFDLYTRVNGIPTTSVWNCRPYSGGTTAETCSMGVNAGDFVGVMVRRYSGSGTFTVTATSVIVPTLENGVPVAGIHNPGSQTLFKLIVPAGASQAQFTMLGDPSSNTCGIVTCTPDADLYVRFGSLPTLSAYSCRPWSYGSVESCTFSAQVLPVTGANPLGAAGGQAHVKNFAGAGKYFVMVHGYSGSGDFVLQGATA